MRYRASTGRTGILVIAIFVVGVIVGRVLWPHVLLPFRNPWNVVGPLTVIKFNPANNLVAFAIFTFLPIGLLLGLFFLNAGNIRAGIGRSDEPVDSDAPRRHYVPSAVMTGGFAVLLIVFAVIDGLNVGTWPPGVRWILFMKVNRWARASPTTKAECRTRNFCFPTGSFRIPAVPRSRSTSSAGRSGPAEHSNPWARFCSSFSWPSSPWHCIHGACTRHS